jgi:hypothetical protein
MKTRVVNCKHSDYDVYIGRPSKWGNPFKTRDYPRGEAIRKYSEWIRNSEEASELRESIHELKGKTLGCWCKPEKCHGDVLVNILEYEDIFEYD